MKKAISLIMVIALLFTCCSTGAGAVISEESEISDYPVIMVAGYSSTNLVEIQEDGTSEQIWSLDAGTIITMVLEYIAEIGIGLGEAAFDNPDRLAKIVGQGVLDLCGHMACNDDGSSAYNVEPMFKTAEETNSQVMYDKFGNNDYQFETDIMGYMYNYIDREDYFNFYVDWRNGAVQCAKDLDNYIQQVKEYCNCDKVNIFAVSHGGQVTGTYLTLYGYKEDVNNAVLTVPALGGAGLVYDIMQEDVQLDELNLLNFIENGLRWENDFHWLVEAQELGFLDGVLNEICPYLMQVVGNWGSFWDFCPTDIYEAMKEKWLDPVENKELIEKSDYMHYTVMPKFYTSLEKCNTDYGMHVSIIAGTDNRITSGTSMNSDGIITTVSSTGATCAPYGERFADGYTQVNSCGGKYKVSPSMTVDASTGYLKDNTWYVSGLFHGMTYWDDYTRDLMMTLLFTDEIENVYSDPEFPQFHASTNACYAVSAMFNNSVEGYLSDNDSTLVLKNLSISNYPLFILGIECEGMDLDFDFNAVNFIKAGETIEIPFTGDIPKESNSKVSINISYFVPGSLTPFGERTVDFTLMNGEKATSTEKTVTADYSGEFDEYLSSSMKQYLKDAGLYKFFRLVFDIWNSAFNSVFNIVR